jgi:hypothetical protein
MILLVIGVAGRNLIQRSQNLEAYDETAYDLLIELIGEPSRLALVPHVLTEVSNLACQGIREPQRSLVRESIAAVIRCAEEHFVPGKQAISAGEYRRLGLTDAVLLEMTRGKMTLWTDDHDLYLAALKRGLPVKKFVHLRVERGHL